MSKSAIAHTALLIAALLLATIQAPPAIAFSIELKAAAPLRIERQRAYTLKTPEKNNIAPDSEAIAQRLQSLGLTAGSPVFVRIFKAESRLELWLRKDDRYVLFRAYPICFWSGKLGPKLREGDHQTPEGFYTITRRGLHWSARWARSLNLGFPNRFDKRNGRSGSYILIHGGCSSIGCFSMTNRIMSDIHFLVRAAMKAGQRHVHVHAFPFRLTEANLAKHAHHQWISFWRDLKPAYDSFERSQRPPRIAVCGRRYVIETSTAKDASAGPIRIIDKRRNRRRSRRLPAANQDAQCPAGTTTATDQRAPLRHAPL